MGERKVPFVMLMLLVLTGCNLIPSRSRVENITPEMIAAKDTGIVILTTGAPGVCNEAAFFLQIRDRKTGEPVPGRCSASTALW